jgi:hypothetical protein
MSRAREQVQIPLRQRSAACSALVPNISGLETWLLFLPPFLFDTCRLVTASPFSHTRRPFAFERRCCLLEDLYLSSSSLTRTHTQRLIDEQRTRLLLLRLHSSHNRTSHHLGRCQPVQADLRSQRPVTHSGTRAFQAVSAHLDRVSVAAAL